MFVLENGDKIQGDASAATVVDYHISGLTGSTLKNLADGQLAATIGDLYTSAATDLAKTIVLTNTDSVARTINLYHTPSGGTARRILPKDMSLAAGGTILFDGENVSVLSASGGLVSSVAISDGSITLAKMADMATASLLGRDTAGTGVPEVLSATEARAVLNVEDGADVTDATNVAAAGAVMDADFNANTILAATVDDTPAPLTIAEQTVVGRITGGNIVGLTAAQLKTMTGYLTDVVDDTTPQLGGSLDTNTFDINLGVDDGIFPTVAPTTDHNASGNKATLTAGENLVFGDVCYIKSDGKAWKADADGTAPAERGLLIALATISADAEGVFALPSTFIRDDTWAWTVGNPIYLSATAGALTQTAPTPALVMGIATHADRMYFYPTIQDAASGGSTDVQSFTTSGTWTKPALTGKTTVFLWGAGGGGGGREWTGHGAGGGGGGSFAEYSFHPDELASTESIVIGAGGAGGTQADGSQGGDSTFGALAIAYGGGGGGSSASTGNTGGGGGGNKEKGSSAVATTLGVGGGYTGFSKGGDGASSSFAPETGNTGGGGGGAGDANRNGATSVNGGGGGGGMGASAGAGGVSLGGGNGGAGQTADTGEAGAVPAGGGGAGRGPSGVGGIGGAGGAGMCIVITI